MSSFKAPSPESLDTSFTSYKVNSFIAQGGMGAVYLGQQISLERPVAIKILPKELDGDDIYPIDYQASFESEAKSLAKLNHSNLVSIYDYGEVDGMLYIVMDYVPGRSLFDSAHGQEVEQLEAAKLISSMCRGLAHAHSHQIIHRDIKPANILIDDQSRPQIVDFGLARPVSQREQGSVILGTKGYTAPEVLANPKDVGIRADIFSVGVMFYELLTGKMPGKEYTPAAEVSPVDPRFDKIIKKALNPLITLRYPNCDKMADAIDQLVHEIQNPTPKKVDEAPAQATPPASEEAAQVAPPQQAPQAVSAAVATPAPSHLITGTTTGQTSSPSVNLNASLKPNTLPAKQSSNTGIIIFLLVAVVVVITLILIALSQQG